MADEQLLQAIDGFFLRSSLTPQDQLDCFNVVKKLYPDKPISPASCQGYCSMTIFVGEDTVIQFRPYNYRLDLRISSAARDVYGTFAPETRYITTLAASGLLVYSMDRIKGISFKDLRASKTLLGRSTYHRARLCKDFAAFISKSWNTDAIERIPLGAVGSSIKSRIQLLSKDLPSHFRPIAQSAFKNLHRIEALPWVLTHGDIVAPNIMVDPSVGCLTGLVDWAEAERLPFGICFYGLEEMLGEMTSTGFQYRRDAEKLRSIFWAELKKNIPDLRQTHVLEAVKLARDLGVLLWQGIAFDDGAIDRVVQEGRDVEEIHRLEAFLDIIPLTSSDRTLKL